MFLTSVPLSAITIWTIKGNPHMVFKRMKVVSKSFNSFMNSLLILHSIQPHFELRVNITKIFFFSFNVVATRFRAKGIDFRSSRSRPYFIIILDLVNFMNYNIYSHSTSYVCTQVNKEGLKPSIKSSDILHLKLRDSRWSF